MKKLVLFLIFVIINSAYSQEEELIDNVKVIDTTSYPLKILVIVDLGVCFPSTNLKSYEKAFNYKVGFGISYRIIDLYLQYRNCSLPYEEDKSNKINITGYFIGTALNYPSKVIIPFIRLGIGTLNFSSPEFVFLSEYGSEYKKLKIDESRTGLNIGLGCNYAVTDNILIGIDFEYEGTLSGISFSFPQINTNFKIKI